MNYIWVTFQKEGIHNYPVAGAYSSLKDVDFLQYQHRHMFHFKVWIEVEHDDRDIEFIQFKRWCEKQYSDGTLQLNNSSCEMIADALAKKINAEYPGRRKLRISVSEDNENGCEMEYN